MTIEELNIAIMDAKQEEREWGCSACTYVNCGTLSKCEMCGAHK